MVGHRTISGQNCLMSDHSYCWSDILSVQAVDSATSTGNSGSLANKHGALGSCMCKNLKLPQQCWDSEGYTDCIMQVCRRDRSILIENLLNYSEDLQCRMIQQRISLGYNVKTVASNLGLDPSTVSRQVFTVYIHSLSTAEASFKFLRMCESEAPCLFARFPKFPVC